MINPVSVSGFNSNRYGTLILIFLEHEVWDREALKLLVNFQ